MVVISEWTMEPTLGALFRCWRYKPYTVAESCV